MTTRRSAHPYYLALLILKIVGCIIAVDLLISAAVTLVANYQLRPYGATVGFVLLNPILPGAHVWNVRVDNQDKEKPAEVTLRMHAPYALGSLRWTDLFMAKVGVKLVAANAELYATFDQDQIKKVAGPEEKPSKPKTPEEKINEVAEIFPWVAHVDVKLENFIFGARDSNEKTPARILFKGDELSYHRDSDYIHFLYIMGNFGGGGAVNLTALLEPREKAPFASARIQLDAFQIKQLNSLTDEILKVDFESAKLDVYGEAILSENILKGYVKPLISNVKTVDWKRERKEKGIGRLMWEKLVEVVFKVFKNEDSKKAATIVPFKVSTANLNLSTMTAIIKVLSNAFITAIRPGFAPGYLPATKE